MDKTKTSGTAMSPTNIFMTGATGFAGGAMLHTLSNTFPDFAITVLVRSEAQEAALHQTYPGLRTVIGTLDSRELLLVEAAKADVVLHASNADHAAGTFSLLDGLKLRKMMKKKKMKQKVKKRAVVLSPTAEEANDSGNDDDNDGYEYDNDNDSDDTGGIFIHVSGAASLINLHNFCPGLSGKVYSDVDDAEEIYQLPNNRLHVAIERRLMREGEAAGVKVVVLAPPMIFPSGTGIGKQDSVGNQLARAIMKTGYPFVIDEGKNSTGWVSTDDLAEVVCFVIKEGLKGSESRLSYGKDGYYFCEAGELEIMEHARATAKVLKQLGAIQTSDLVRITPHESLELNDLAILLWGSSMRTRADKLRKLGWKPKTEDWEPFVKEMAIVEFEAARLSGKVSRDRRSSGSSSRRTSSSSSS